MQTSLVCSKFPSWAGEFVQSLKPYGLGVYNLTLPMLVRLLCTVSGVPNLAFVHGRFPDQVVSYLECRNANIADPREALPVCNVSTGLLLLLSVTGGRNDLVQCILKMDQFYRQEANVKNADAYPMLVKRLDKKVKDTLGKISGKNGDRAKMLSKGADPHSIAACLNQPLHERYVSMPTKSSTQR